ncbi:beta- -galactosyltransferase 3 [Nannochloropsis gaditana]|uniref:Beta--galactosyltransferase 3 n=1 Tax=Nannochloropsis gaditana TaxID=72520 RepID=W7TKN1_9STRA|nr:beta- -galactosyltransferase 3 [Nannochloropsis gaditana]
MPAPVEPRPPCASDTDTGQNRQPQEQQPQSSLPGTFPTLSGPDATSNSIPGGGNSEGSCPGPSPSVTKDVAETALREDRGNGSERQERATSILIVPYRDLYPEQERARHLQRFLREMPALLTAFGDPARRKTGGGGGEGVGEQREGVPEGKESEGKGRGQKEEEGEGKEGSGSPGAPLYHIYIVEQSKDGRKFNRGKLLNIGFDVALKDGEGTGEGGKEGGRAAASVFIFHDVDLLPSRELVPLYLTRPSRPLHIARAWGRYSGNPRYLGGAIAFNATDFQKINGFPNTFWGWGGEDDEMRKRVEQVGLEVGAPAAEEGGRMEDMEGVSLEEKLQALRRNREWKCNVKWEALGEHAETWRQNGLKDLRYEVMGREELEGEVGGGGGRITKLTVDVRENGHWTDTVVEIEGPAGGGGKGGKRGREGERKGPGGRGRWRR